MMKKVRKHKDDQLIEHLFDQKLPKREHADVTNVGNDLKEFPSSPVPKKRLVPKKIIAKEPDQRCMNILAKHWDKLRVMAMVSEVPNRTFRGYTYDDVLIETFEYVIREEQVKGAAEEEITNLFIYRFNNLMWVV